MSQRVTRLSPRHCERSEAIHSFFMPGHGLLRGACHRARIHATRWLAMTVDAVSHSRDADRPRFASSFALLEIRGRREGRVLAAPAFPRAICANKTAHEHTGQREHSGLPCAMALRLTSCSSRRTALLPPSPPRSFASKGLSASTAAPEPHDLTVRFRRVRLSRPSRPSHLSARS
jgi:hypothetical protein